MPNAISSIFQTLSLWLVKRFAGAVFVNSRDTATQIGIDLAKTKIYVMTHGMEHLPSLPPVSVSARSGSLFVGRLVPTKGVDDLLHAWSYVVQSLPDATLTIAGIGSARYVEYLRRLAARLGVDDRVTFAGCVSENEKARLLNCSQAFVFPSKEEGWGIAIGEAMSYGLPCVLYDLPAYRGVFIQGCFRSAVGDIKSFARNVLAILEDDALRARMSSEALDLAATFSWHRAASIEYDALREMT